MRFQVVVDNSGGFAKGVMIYHIHFVDKVGVDRKSLGGVTKRSSE